MLDISIHASYANDATVSQLFAKVPVKFQSTHRTQTMRPQIRNKNIEYSFLFNNLINSLNLTCDISLNLA